MKRSKCANLKSCITEQRKSPRSTISVNKSCNYSITSAAPTESAKIYISRSNDVIATEISTCKMKDVGIEMTCDSIDDQDNGVEMCDKDDIVDQSCLCGGFSIFNRHFL